MIFHENRLPADDLMKYHTLFFEQIKKVIVKLSSAAAVIGALTLYAIIATFAGFEISCNLKKNMENEAFALLEQMLYFP